jgi:hypothetical protein
VTVPHDISEDIPYDITYTGTSTTFTLTDTAYDVVIDDLAFVANVSNQNPYKRETAPYKKDQFDNSIEPGEQSLTGWWLRSQTSWHNGSGITFYDPGTDYEHVSHRFNDSRGIDVWTPGEATLLPEVFHGYTGSNGINAASGRNGSSDVLVSGDSAGYLKRITLDSNSSATAADFYNGATYPEGHNGTVYSFLSVTTDGSNYYAACKRAIHTGNIATLSSDEVAFNFSTTDRTDVFIKYVKGYVLFGLGNGLYNMPLIPYGAGRTTSTHNHSGGTDSLPTGADLKKHINPSWIWVDATGTPESIFVAGNGGNNSEIWQIKFDETTTNLGMSDATMALSLPNGETINAIHYYLGYLAIGTNKGVRICPISSTGNIVMGPLLIESTYSVNGFTERGTYLYAATKVDDGSYTNGCVIRIDLSQEFNDGTFAYAYDLEYRSSLDSDSSDCTEVYNIDDRLVLVIEEDSAAGELQVEHTIDKRDTGWLRTGKIRYSTVEPKFFRYINLQCTTGAGDNITISVVNKENSEITQAVVTEGLSNLDILLSAIPDKEEYVAFKFTFNNVTEDQELPVLEAYQIKATPGTRRQRMYQYPLSCYDNEMDRFGSQFGYTGRAMEFIQRLEAIEETGRFVSITDYRVGEQYQGIIEEVRFTNESSPDKDNSGFGGLLIVTVRKL